MELSNKFKKIRKKSGGLRKRLCKSLYYNDLENVAFE